MKRSRSPRGLILIMSLQNDILQSEKSFDSNIKQYMLSYESNLCHKFPKSTEKDAVGATCRVQTSQSLRQLRAQFMLGQLLTAQSFSQADIKYDGRKEGHDERPEGKRRTLRPS